MGGKSQGKRSNAAAGVGNRVGLTKEVEILAPARRVFQAISTADGLGRWWSYYLTGPSSEDGEILLKWPRSGHHARLRLAEVKEPRFVAWSVIEHRPFNEWDGTTIRFSLDESGPEETRLVLHHAGLAPECDCYRDCSSGWEYLVGQIKKLVEQGFT